MPAIVFADRRQNPRRFTASHDDHDLIGLRPAEVRVDEFIAPTRRRLDDRRAPRLGVGHHPPLGLGGDVAEHRSTHGILVAVRVEEPDHALRLLERLDQPVDQDPIEAPIPEPNFILVIRRRCSWRFLQVSAPAGYRRECPYEHRGGARSPPYNQPRALPFTTARITGISRAEPLAG